MTEKTGGNNISNTSFLYNLRAEIYCKTYSAACLEIFTKNF